METIKVESLDPIVNSYKSTSPKALCMVTVYTNTTADFPGEHVARLFLVEHGKVFKTPYAVIGGDLKALRGGIPRGMRNVGRKSGDDPVIMEVWV